MCEVIDAAGPPTVDRPYVKQPDIEDVCDRGPNVVRALEYHVPNSTLLGRVMRRFTGPSTMTVVSWTRPTASPQHTSSSSEPT
jgi:hypothetical protein